MLDRTFDLVLEIARLARKDSSIDPDGKALTMVTHTLDKMGDGGIMDHLGGGFYRYSGLFMLFPLVTFIFSFRW